ncbi:MAG TPA: NAD-dependent epimerase/dehydratase family protein [Acidimicrobiia bacterium]
MHYFVTGATGFLGGHVTARLLDGGHRVTALVLTRDEAREISEYGVRPHVGSVTDKETLRRGMRGVDGVFHVAGSRVAFGDRKTAEVVNVDGTRNVLEVVRELGIAKVVHTSTLSVFSDTHGQVVDETHRFTGTHLTDYDRMRARAHYEVTLPLMELGLPGVILLPGAMYGPHDMSVMAGLLGRYLLGRVQVVSAGAAYCWAHVADVAQAHLLAMEFGRVGEQYIVGGEPHTVREVLAEAGRLVGRPRPPIPAPAWVVRPVAAVVRAAAAVVPRWRPVADRLRVATGVTYLGDDAKARAELGFNPRPLSEGLPDAIEWLLRDMFEAA